MKNNNQNINNYSLLIKKIKIITKHLFTFRRRPNESLTDRVLSGSTAGVERTVKRVSNECRMTLDRPSTYTLSHSSVHQQAATLPNNAACGNNKRLCRSTIPSFKKVASLLLLLALSFGFSSQAWAFNYSGGYFYFDGSNSYFNNKCIQLCGRQDNYTAVTQLSGPITGTKLYYTGSLNHTDWGNFKGWFMIANSGCWNDGNFSEQDNNLTWSSSWQSNNLDAGTTYLIVPEKTQDWRNGSITVTNDWTGSAHTGYNFLNRSQAVKVYVKKAGASNYTSSDTWYGTIKAERVNMTNNGTSSSSTKTLSSSDASVTTAYTSTVTFKESSTTSGYTFKGWGTSSTATPDGNTTKTYTVTGNATIYAFFEENTYYLKHPWDGGDWTWKKLTSNGNGTYSIEDYGGNGCNWNTATSDDGSKWIDTPTLIGNPISGDLCTFTLDPSANSGNGSITITFIERPFTVPSAVTVDGPLNNGHSGQDDGWGSCGTTQKSTSGNITTFTYTKTRDAGNYQFCFKTSDCKDLLHYPNVTIGTISNCTLVDNGGTWHNFKITTTTNGQITITVVYDTDHKTITVNATGPTPTHTITPVAKYTNDGSTYTTGTTGGTVKINDNTSAQSVTEGSTYTINATAAPGYVIEQVMVGSTYPYPYQYVKGNTTITEWSNSYTSTTDLSVTVKFAKVQDIQIWVQKNGHNGFSLQNSLPQIGSVTLDGKSGANIWTDQGNGWISYDFGTVTKVTTVGVAYENSGVVCQDHTMTQTEYWSDAQGGVWQSYDDICGLVSVSLSNCTTTVSTGITLSPTYATAPSGSTTYAWSVTSKPDGSNPSFSSDNTATTTFTADKTGNYTVQISMTSGDCATKTATATITVNKAPATPTITSASVVKSPIRTGETFQVQFTYAGITSGDKYRIKIGDGYYSPDWTVLSSTSGNVTFTSTGDAPVGTNTVFVEIWEADQSSMLVYESAGTLKVVQMQTISIVSEDNNKGTVSPSSVQAADGVESVEFTATPNAGYEFDYWETSAATITVANDHSATTKITSATTDGWVRAHFRAQSYAISDPQVSTSSIPFTGAPVDVTLTATSTYLSDPIVVFEVNDGTTTFEIVGTTGAIGAASNYSTTHTATFSVTKAGTFTVAAKLYAGYLVDNFETNSKTSWERVDNVGNYEYVANPAMQAKNGGKNVQKIIRSGAFYQTALTHITSQSGYSYAHIRQYRENTTDASWLKISDTDGCFSNRAKCSSEAFAANTWQDIVYNIEGCAVDFIYPMVAEGASMTSFYIDDIILSKEQDMTLQASGAHTATITSTAISLSLEVTTPAPIVVGETSVTITPTLTAPAGQYTICYKLLQNDVEVNPQPTFDINDAGKATFTAPAAGTYMVKANIHASDCQSDILTSAQTAITVKGKHKLTVAAGTGIASVGGGQNAAVEGEEYELTATLKDGYENLTWTPTGAGATVRQDGNKWYGQVGTEDATFTASATPISYTLTMPQSGTGYTVEYTGGTSIPCDQMVNFTVTPAIGYDVEVSMNGTPLSGSNNAYSFTMPAAAAEVTVVASLHNYTINFVVNPAVGGSIIQPATTPKTDAHYNVPFVIEALENTGYHFVNWTSTDDITLGVEYLMNAKAPARKLANNVELQTSSSQRVSNAVLVAVGGAKTITANFEAEEYTVTLNANGGTAGTTTQVTATYGANMPIIATAALPTWGGHEFLGYYDDETAGTQYYTSTGASARTWNKTDANVTLYAHWQEVHYYIEGRFGVRSTVESENIDKFVNDAAGTWKIDSKNIELLYNETAHAYQLNTYCSVSELSQKLGGTEQFFHIAEVKGNSESFTQYAVKTNNYQFKNGSQSTTLEQTDERNIYFNDTEDNSKPVVLTYDPTTKTLSYTATALQFTVDFGLCDGQSATEGSIGATVNSEAIATGSKQNENTVIAFTAAPQAGYTIQGWYSDAACTKVIADFGTTSSHDVTLKKDTSVYVKFTPLTVYFINTEKWDNVYAYNYTGEDKHSGAWPGAAMTKESTVTIQGRTFDVYKYNNVVDGSKIIFNNGESEDGKKQTADLTVTGNYGKYFMADECFAAGTDPSVKPDGTWYNSLAEAQAHGLDCTTDVLVVFDIANEFGAITATAQIGGGTPTPITSGALVDKGAKLVFKAEPTSYYSVEGFYWNNACSDDTRYTDAVGSTLTLNNVLNDTYVYARFEQYFDVEIGVADGQSAMGSTQPANTIKQVGSFSVRTAEAISSDPLLYSFDHWSLTIDNVEKADWTGKDDKTYGITLHDTCTIYYPLIRINATEADAKLTAHFKARDVVTLYFVNSDNWSNVHVHLWGGTAEGTKWPGIEPELYDKQVNGHDVYYVTFDNGAYTQYIWNCGSDACKTFTLDVDKNNPVYNLRDNTLYPSLDAVLPDPYESSTWKIWFNSTQVGLHLLNYDNGHVWTCDVEVPKHEHNYSNWVKMVEDGHDRGFSDVTTDNEEITSFPTTKTATENNGKQFTINHGQEGIVNMTFTFDDQTRKLTIDYTQPSAILLTSVNEWDVDSKEPLVLRGYAKNATADCTYQFAYSTDGGTNWTDIGRASNDNVIEVTKEDLATVPNKLGTYQFKVVVTTTHKGETIQPEATKDVYLYKYYWLALKEMAANDNWANHIYVKSNTTQLADFPGVPLVTEKSSDNYYYHFYKFQYPTYTVLNWNDGNTGEQSNGSGDLDFDPTKLCHAITKAENRKWTIDQDATCPPRIYREFLANEYTISLDGTLTLTPTIRYYGSDELTYTWTIESGSDNVVLSSTNTPQTIVNPTKTGDAEVKFVVSDGNESHEYLIYIHIIDGITIRVFNTYGPEFCSENWWLPYIHVWADGVAGSDHQMTNEGNGWYSYTTNLNPVNFLVKRDGNTGQSTEMTLNVMNVTESGCWKVSTYQWNDGADKYKHLIDKTDSCDLYFRVHETMADGKTTYHSNKVTKVGQDLSFYAAKDGTLTLQHYDEAANKYVDIKTLTNPEESYVQVAKFEGNGISNMEKYTGDYWLRTNAFGNWNNYINDAQKFTEFTRNSRFKNEEYNYYFVHHFNKGTLVTGQVANHINDNLATFIKADAFTDGDGKLPAEGVSNVRFGYCPETNYFKRAIINGSSVEHFVEVYGDNSTYFNGGQNNSTLYRSTELTDANKIWRDGDNNHSLKFTDMSDWVYQANVYATVDNLRNADTRAVIAAEYNGIWNYLLGYDDVKQRPTFAYDVLGSTSSKNITYAITLIYDFKTNRLMSAWTPTDMTVEESMEVDADVMFLRHENEDVAQIGIANETATVDNLNGVVFVLEVESDGDANTEKHYWVSTPFDVKVSDIFGLESFYDGVTDGNWGIQRYRGDLRAKTGWWAEGPDTWWEWMTKDDTMKAGEGYLISIVKDAYEWPNIVIDGKEKAIKRIYFPSVTSHLQMSRTKGESITQTYENQPCPFTRDRRDLKDGNWKIIGANSYNNAIATDGKAEGTYNDDDDTPTDGSEGSKLPNFRYVHHDAPTVAGQSYTAELGYGTDVVYRAFYSYPVQYAGTITWQPFTTDDQKVQGIAPRRYVAENEVTNVILRLELQQNGKMMDQTFVQFNDAATTSYDLNLDLGKMGCGSKISEISTLDDDGVVYAGNSMPSGEYVIPVGANIKTAGTYTFAMPAGTENMTVYLLDYETGDKIDLGLGNYTVTFSKKANLKDRFALMIDNRKLPTDTKVMDANGNELIKFIRNEQMYILRNGRLYNANGAELSK